MSSERPLGVTMIALLFLLSSLLTFGVLLLGVLQPAWIASLRHLGQDIKAAGSNVGAFVLVGASYAALAAGLWRLQRWARFIIMFLAGTSLIIAVAGIALGVLSHRPLPVFLWFSAGLSGIIVLYLRQSRIKAAFRS